MLRNWSTTRVAERQLFATSDGSCSRPGVFDWKFEHWTGEFVQGAREQGVVLPQDYQILSNTDRFTCCQERMGVQRGDWGERWGLQEVPKGFSGDTAQQQRGSSSSVKVRSSRGFRLQDNQEGGHDQDSSSFSETPPIFLYSLLTRFILSNVRIIGDSVVKTVLKHLLLYTGVYLRWENRAGDRPGVRVPGMEIPWNPDTNLALDPNDSNLF